MNKTAHPDEDGTPMTTPLPDRIAAAIERHADLWHAYGKSAVATPESFAMGKAAEAAGDELRALVAELVGQREVDALRTDLNATKAKLAKLWRAHRLEAGRRALAAAEQGGA